MGEHELLNGSQQQHQQHQQQQQHHQNSQSPNPLVCIQTASSITNDNNSLASSPLPKSQNSSAINVNSIINGNINAGSYIVCHFILKLICLSVIYVWFVAPFTLYVCHMLLHAIYFIYLFFFPLINL